MWSQATLVLPHGKAYIRHNEPKCRNSHREHCKDDGTRINRKHADLRTGDGLQDFGRHGQAHRKTFFKGKGEQRAGGKRTLERLNI